MSVGYRYDEINQALAGDCDALAMHLFGTPSRRSKKAWEWKTGDRLELTRTGSHRGWFRDWRAGKSYSPIGAAAYALGMSYADAAQWAAVEFLRWPDLSGRTFSDTEKAAHEKAQAEAERARQQRQSEADREEAADNARRIEQALALWRRGVPIKGTPAETYLRGRGIRADSWPDTVRWHAGERKLLVLSTAPEGDGTAVQAIHLDDSGKPVKRDDGSKIKITRGVLRGGAVKFSGAADGPVIICEGPETALAVWYATGFEAWAGLGSISGVSVETVPHGRIIVACPDDDAQSANTIQAAKKTIKRWQGEGRTVLIATPYDTLKRDKSDHNDALQKHGRDYVARRILNVLEPGVEFGAPEMPLGKAREDLSHATNKAMEQLITEAIARQLEDDARKREAIASKRDGHANKLDDDARKLEAIARKLEAIARTNATSQIGIRVSVGGGKTKEAIEAMVSGVARMRKELGPHIPSIVYTVPTHRLGGELIHRMEAEAAAQGINVSARIWRGREAIEPETGEQMCLNIDAVEAAQKAMLRPQEAVCKSADGTCPFFSACHYQEQKRATADIWLVAHASLFHERPKAIGQPAVRIVDEGIWQASLRGFDPQKTAVGFGSLQRHPRMLRENVVGDDVLDVMSAADLRETRHKLVTALRSLDAQKGEHLKVATLLDAGLTAEMCRRAMALEWMRQTNGSIRPGMEGESFKRRTDELIEAQGDIRRLATMWQLLAEAIDSGQEASGRLTYELVKDGSGAEHEALVMRWTSGISQGWEAPTLHVDATLRPELVQHLFPRLRMAADIRVAAPHQRTVAVVGKAFSHRALTDEKDVLKMWRAVLLRARLTAGDTLVVVPKRAKDIILAKETIPSHIHLLNHNGTAGLDSFGQVRRLIVVGRTLPSPGDVSLMTAAITGKPPEPIGTADGWYQVEMATVRARDGSTVTLPRERHLTGLPDAIRASVCEDQLIQAMGRGRGVNRTADTPLEVEIWGDCEPPVDVDAFHLFKAPSKDEQAMAAGLWVEAAADLSALHPTMGSANTIKAARQRLGTNSSYNTNWETYPTSRETEAADEMTALAQRFLKSAPHLRLAAYRKTGPGTRPGVAIWDPRVCDDPRASLTAKLGELAVWAENRWSAPAEAAAEPAPALEPMPAPLPAPPAPVSAGVGYGSGGYGVGAYKGSAGPPDAILTSPHNVSPLPARNVSARALVPRHLLRGASPAILNLGFKPAPPPAWLTGGRR